MSAVIIVVLNHSSEVKVITPESPLKASLLSSFRSQIQCGLDVSRKELTLRRTQIFLSQVESKLQKVRKVFGNHR
jgi:hypothetical protein